MRENNMADNVTTYMALRDRLYAHRRRRKNPSYDQSDSQEAEILKAMEDLWHNLIYTEVQEVIRRRGAE